MRGENRNLWRVELVCYAYAGSKSVCSGKWDGSVSGDQSALQSGTSDRRSVGRWRIDHGTGTCGGPEHAADREWIIKEDMPVFAYSSMSCGFISGTFRSDDRAGAERFLTPPGKKGYFADENFERLRRAEELAEKYDVTVAQIAMAWLFNQEMKVIPLQGGENAQMYRQTLKAAEMKLSREEVDWLDLRGE